MRVVERMQFMQRKNGVALPLDPNTGKVFCATCHNPHARGVVRVAAAAKGAGDVKIACACRRCARTAMTSESGSAGAKES